MNRRFRAFAPAILALFVLIAALWGGFASQPALAGNSALAPCPAGPIIDKVQPKTIYSDSPAILTITGLGFDPASVVVLDGFSTLVTTYVSATVLTAQVPAGVPGDANGKDYDVRVINPNTSCDVKKDAVTVIDRSATQVPTNTPLPTEFSRPLVTILSYVPSTKPPLYPGQEFDFAITLQNTGQLVAKNVIVFFPAGDVIPRNTGGTRTVGDMAPGQTVNFAQPLRVDSNLFGYEAVITVEISYTDPYGNPYTETSVLSFEAGQYVNTPTPNPTLSVRPQIIVEEYRTEPDILAPGTVFTLDLSAVNVSSEVARQVVVTLNIPETSLKSIAPLSTGSTRYIEQLGPGDRMPISYQLAVAGDAEGGLVPIQFTLSYIDNYNTQHTQTETISLAIDAVPHLRVGLFEPLPDFIQVGDVFDVAVEVINIGTQTVNISTVEIIGDGRLRITDGSLYIGPLDAGTSGTLVATAEALQVGTSTIEVRVNYLNSFQQEETITQTITIEIEAAPIVEFPEGEAPDEADDGELTLAERLWRALLGFFGLGTRSPEESMPPMPGAVPAEEENERP